METGNGSGAFRGAWQRLFPAPHGFPQPASLHADPFQHDVLDDASKDIISRPNQPGATHNGAGWTRGHALILSLP